MVVQKITSQQTITNIHDGPYTVFMKMSEAHSPLQQRKVRITCCLEFINWRLTITILPVLPTASVRAHKSHTRERERESGSF